jgi:murein DD-endopeptidase MepM/ murein hydrolase activator NlpD
VAWCRPAPAANSDLFCREDAMTAISQTIVIPQDRYWEWVQAVRDYAVHFGATISPDRENAGRFSGQQGAVTIITFPGAWPDDIVRWFQQNYAALQLDVIDANSPQVLEDLLAERIANDDRLGRRGSAFRLLWPTDYDVITQPFGVNPAYYRRFGLPGHEGVDIRALYHTPIYAAAPGRVYLVYEGGLYHAYGIHVRIRHTGGYKTIYAHLAQALVEVGDEVEAGQVIGWADSTGNSTASHLHLTLKKEGATAAGETRFPKDIIDPTPYLQRPERPQEPLWLPGHCLVGVHGRVGGPLQDPDLAAAQRARVEAVKLMPGADTAIIDHLREIDPNIFILARLSTDLVDGRVIAPEAFVEQQNQDLESLYERGVRYYEIHHEPNLNLGGFGASWKSGDDFQVWFLDVIGLLRTRFPDARFGFPGCAPGEEIVGKREELWRFLGRCETAIEASDWLGVHCYWEDEQGIRSPEGGLTFAEYQRRWPHKLLFVTEFGNVSPDSDSATKGRQYVEYYRDLRNRAGIAAAFSFVLSASEGYEHEVWRREDGQMTAIPALVGDRQF